MWKEELSGSESESDSSSEELEESPRNTRNQKMSEYEKQRIKRIEENKARMEAMGLHKMANSLMNSVQKTVKKNVPKGKRKLVEEDEEYRPPQGEDMLCSSGSSDKDDIDEADESSRSRKKGKKRSTTPKNRVPAQKMQSNSDFIDDDDDALMQAIALSLQDSAGFLDIAKSVPYHKSEVSIKGESPRITGSNNTQEDAGKRKRKKLATSRVQMTKDELLVHFFQFDEADKGSITLRDLQRVAAAHDFTWTDKDMADMISCFDNDGDGKLSLYDFHNIVTRCNMLQSSENVL